MKEPLLNTGEWYAAKGVENIGSPALLVYPRRIEENIRRMISRAGSADKLRPHVKTHKMEKVIELCLFQGITRFKCSTLSEVGMTARCGVPDVMLAMQPVGPMIDSYLDMQQHFPKTVFSVIVDNQQVSWSLSEKAKVRGMLAQVWLDVNNGMNRTGIKPGKEALQLYHLLCGLTGIQVRGLHVYDGHIHEHETDERKHAVDKDFEPVNVLIENIRKDNLPVPAIVAGGTPSFPFHVNRDGVEASPGTPLLWDAGYAENFPDLEFLYAATLITRVVSKPDKDLLCLDLGHKAIAAEMAPPRLKLIGIPDAAFQTHSEEHLVIQTRDARNFKPGDLFYVIPWHICPTVPRYPFAYVVENHQIKGTWNIDARDRLITL